jgi:hypothetical protein
VCFIRILSLFQRLVLRSYLVGFTWGNNVGEVRTQRGSSGPTHKRTEGQVKVKLILSPKQRRAPVWDSEFTTKAVEIQKNYSPAFVSWALTKLLRTPAAPFKRPRL